jgi:hypothetical protein
MSGRSLVSLAVAASVAMAALYLALGGGSYEPTPVADPCAPREWREPEGVEEAGQQFALSALDGAACELRVTREALALALATEESRARFADEYGIDNARLEQAIRAGVIRAVDDAQDAGAIDPLVAAGLRAVAERLPLDELIALIEDAGELFADVDGFLDGLDPDSVAEGIRGLVE